jgi:RNA polymerase sigma-70 factor (ECF subfamily)
VTNDAPRPGDPAPAAVRWLFDNEAPRLYSLALRLCRNDQDAQDMVQEVFLQAQRRWSTYRGDAAPSTWLYAIAAHACKTRLRRKGGADRRAPAMSQLAPWTEATIAALPAAPGAAIDHEATEAVHAAILKLPEPFRQSLIFKDILDLPVADAAQALGIKPATLKTRVHRARLFLRKALLARLGTQPAPEPVYQKQVCMDLLSAKLEAMDRGRAFPIPQAVVCERCLAVFAELDLGQRACEQLAHDSMPAPVRAAILRAIAAPAMKPASARAPA